MYFVQKAVYLKFTSYIKYIQLSFYAIFYTKHIYREKKSFTFFTRFFFLKNAISFYAYAKIFAHKKRVEYTRLLLGI